jgi:hypothetical protein
MIRIAITNLGLASHMYIQMHLNVTYLKRLSHDAFCKEMKVNSVDMYGISRS